MENFVRNVSGVIRGSNLDVFEMKMGEFCRLQDSRLAQQAVPTRAFTIIARTQ